MDIRHCIVRVGIGSGVLVQGKNDVRYILTCTHVLGEDWQNVPVAFCNEAGLFSIQTSTAIATDPAPIDAEDIALLHCPLEIPVHYQAVKLLHSQHGRELPAYTFGFPANFTENGRNDRCRIDRLSVNNDRGYELLKLNESQAMKGGFSGSPLLDAHAQHCLGILSDLERPDIDNYLTLTYAVPAEITGEFFSGYLNTQELSPYLETLRGMYQDVVLNDPKGMTLGDIYVEPYYGIHRYCFKEKDKRLEEDKNKPFVNFNTSLNHDILRLLNQEDCHQLDGKKPGLILLLGYPGQGKTSFCKRLIYDITGASSLAFEHIYFVRLRNVSNPADLANNALKVIQSEIQEESDAPPIKWNNSLLILDGLDELNIKDGFHGGKIDDICKSLEQACEKYPGLRIVLSSRYGYVDLDALKKRNITILRLEEFSIDQQKGWLEKYRAERFHPESPLSPEKLEEYHKHASIRELLGQAILLHMIASLEEDASGKPNRAAIYDSLFSQLVDRTWSDQGQISILKDIGLDKKMLRYALQDIAHAIFMSGKGYLRRADLEKLPKVKTIQDKLKQNNRGVELWRTVMIAAYLDEKKKNKEDQDDQEQAAYGIEFLHKSLYEYLCAEKMWRDICNGFLSRDRENEWSIMEGKVALDLASKVFSAQSISQEVNDYLIEIIANHNSLEDKQMLSQRMGLFLPYCLERNFLHKFDSDLEKEPFSKATSVFIGYWSILINLDQKKNYFPFPYRAQNFINMCFSYFFEIKFIRRMNFSFQDFSDLNMARIVLIESDLSKSNLSNSNLNMAILYRVILKEANLKGAFFFRTRLDGANMIDSKLEGAFMKEADLLQVNLAGADLRNAELIGANLSGAILFRSNLANANLTGANLQDANLIGANFENADLSDVDMTRANLEGANFNFKQLSQVKSLFSAKNIPKELFNQIKSKKPHLLELPKGRGR